MRAWAAYALAAMATAALAEEPLDVPSGQPVAFHDTVMDAPGPAGRTMRFRFVAPQIARDGGTMPFVMAEADMEYLCQTYALPRLPTMGPPVAQIVITLMDRPVPFGVTMPEATQFFEAYRAEDGRCVWEGF